jgi:hypothetical protein
MRSRIRPGRAQPADERNRPMTRSTYSFRLKAFGLHLLVSATVLSLSLGTLYLGWYHWPGWYLTGVSSVTAVLAGVDLVLGPLLTLIIASPRKPRRELARDIAVIGFIQLAALAYGTIQLWNGRPLYYAFSENCLSVVQAYDLDPEDVAAARRDHVDLAPHWYSVPRWIWAPLPADSAHSDQIMRSALTGGFDVTGMPRYFKPWDQGLPALRDQLKAVNDINFFTLEEKKILAQRMRAAGLAPDRKNALPLTGRGRPLLAVFDPESLRMTAIFEG